MTTNFVQSLGGYFLRNDNNQPYLFSPIEFTYLTNENGEVNNSPFIILAIKPNNNFWKKVEVIFFDKYKTFEEFNQAYTVENLDTKLYIHYASMALLDFLIYSHSDIKEYLNHS